MSFKAEKIWTPRETPGKNHMKIQQEGKPRREASGETKLADILTLDFQAPGLRGNTVLFFKPPSLRYFVTAILKMNTDIGLGIGGTGRIREACRKQNRSLGLRIGVYRITLPSDNFRSQ